jgi:ABC-type polysaccharide/polyol phosphate transport system ATPase subunit
LAEWVLPAAKAPILHWVLRDISFRVEPGEAVGIIGINGAGKSTLLKIITGTTQLTTGRVELTGSVAAMLELGMGFHPDFTGRQNVFMAGQLLGMGAEEISRLMSGIESFAEIGEYIDQPVRVYSSGMQMRLAFSVATARRPDILIVDEALSVGDAYFQHKVSIAYASSDRRGRLCSSSLMTSKRFRAFAIARSSLMGDGWRKKGNPRLSWISTMHCSPTDKIKPFYKGCETMDVSRPFPGPGKQQSRRCGCSTVAARLLVANVGEESPRGQGPCQRPDPTTRDRLHD